MHRIHAIVCMEISEEKFMTGGRDRDGGRGCGERQLKLGGIW